MTDITTEDLLEVARGVFPENESRIKESADLKR